MSSARHSKVSFNLSEGDNPVVKLRFALRDKRFVSTREYDLVFEFWSSLTDEALFDAVKRAIEDHAAFMQFTKLETPSRTASIIIVRVKLGSVHNFEKRAVDIAIEIVRDVLSKLSPMVRDTAAIASLADSLKGTELASTGARNGYVNDPPGHRGRRRRS